MKRMSKKWLALMLAASLVISEGSFVSLAQTSNTDPVVVAPVEESVEESTEEASEESSEEATEESSEEASEESSEEATEESSEEASEESSEEATEESSEEASEESTEEAAEVKMFPGVAEGVTLGVNDEANREDLLANMENAGDFAEGVDCVENEILVMVDSEDLAEEYAAAFNGTVKQYIEGVAVITLNADATLPVASVRDAVMASADPANNLPVAWPNTIYSILPIELDADAELINEVSVAEVAAEELVGDVSASDATDGDPVLAQGEEYDSILAYNDPYLKSNAGTKYQWFHSAIGSAYAWNAGYTGAGVKVAVIDTGAELNHEDLNVTRLKVSSCTNLEDAVGHGSHVCGLVGAKANNGKGGTGIAPGVTLYSIKISDASSFSTDVILEAMTIAKNQGVDLVNMSLGGPVYNGTFQNKVTELTNAGIAVFCASGNESTTAWAYPAAYNGAISIAALDKSMQRTYFSNHGSTIDYAAPGYDIYSCYNQGTNSYTSMPGTSMACPIAVGTAAVVLQYARATKAYTEVNGPADVDNLMKLLNKGAVKAGTGTGKGYVSIPKALNLSTSVKAPAAPTFSVKAGTYNVASLNVSLSAEKGCTIYYSLDGKTPTFKKGVVTNGTLYTKAFAVTGKKAVTVKAIAVNSSGKMVSKVASAKYTLKPLVSGLSLTAQGGVTKIAQGKSVQINANITPDYAANKKLTWTIAPANQGVTVKNGKVAATAKATAGTYTVTATTQDGSNKSAAIKITVAAASTNPVTKIQKVTKGNVAVITGGSQNVEIKITKKDKTTNAAANTLTWTTENAKVATVVASSSNYVTIKGVSKGKTNIIGKATDGSGVQLKIPVTVGQRVSSILLSGGSQVNAGKSITLKAELNKNGEAPANKTLNWTVSPADKGVTVKNGKVTASKNATLGNYVITATAADGSGTKATKTVTVVKSLITNIKLSTTKATLFRVAPSTATTANKITIPVTVTGGNAANWEVKSSAEGIATAVRSGNNVVITATGNATGSVTVTVTANDGSNKKATCKVTVKNPASSLTISTTGGRCYDLARGKSLQLKATLGDEFGKLDGSSKKLKWTSSNTKVMTVSSSGKVTAVKNNGYATITATTTDGSNISSSVVIYATADIAQLKIRNSSGSTISSIRIPEGYNTTVKVAAYVGIEDMISGTWYPSDDLCTTVSGKGGVGVKPSGSSLILVGNKKGTYTVTVKCQNGSSAKANLKVTVY